MMVLFGSGHVLFLNTLLELSYTEFIFLQVVLPFPDKEKTFAYTDKDIPILGRFVGSAHCSNGSLDHPHLILILILIILLIDQTVLLIILTRVRFTGDKDVVLKMPPGRKVSDLK